MANPTAETIIGLTRDLLREGSGSDVPVIGDSFLYEAINDGQGKWVDAFNQTGEESVASKRETGFDLVADTTLDEASNITTSDTEFTVNDANDFDASNGALIIWDDNIPDFVNYTTWTSGTKTFSGVTGLDFAHEDYDAVQKLYKLPTNFGSFRESPTHGDGVMVNGVPYRFIQGAPTPGFFSIYDDGTNKFLVLPRGLSGSASVVYNVDFTDIDESSDTVVTPDKYKFFLVWHCVAYAYVGRSDDAQRMLFAQQESEKILRRALQSRNTGKKVRTRPFGNSTKDYFALDGRFYRI